MKLELKVTKRDKVLLVVLAVIAVLASYIYFGVMKTGEKIDALTIRQESLEMKKQEMAIKLKHIPINEAQLEENENKYEEIIDVLFPYMTDDEIGAYVTGLCRNNLVKVSQLNIQNAQYMDIAPYRYSQKVKDAEENGTELWENTDIVYSCQVSCTVVGVEHQIRNLIDQLSAEEGIRVRSFSIADVTRQVGTGSNTHYVNKKELTIHFVIYMY